MATPCSTERTGRACSLLTCCVFSTTTRRGSHDPAPPNRAHMPRRLLDSRKPSSCEVPMRLIGLAVMLAVGLSAAPFGAEGQQAGKLSRIGVLMNLYSPDADPPQAFRQGLRDLGYVEGQNLIIDWRYQLGRTDRLPPLAAELVRLKPDVVVADVTVAIRAAMQATSTIPIVMAS